MGEEFILDIITALNKQLSKKQIKSDLKSMDNSMFVNVISKLSIALSQRQLKKDLKQLNDLYLQVGADLKIDSALKKKLQGRIKTLQDNISDLQIGVSTKSSNIAKTVTEARNKGQRAADKTAISFNIEVKREKAIADLEYIAKKYSKLFSNASASQKYNNILDAAYGITDAKQLSNVRAQIAAFTSELKANDLASQSLGDRWKNLIARCKDMFSAASVVTLIFSQVKQAVSSFLQLDTAMTNLYKVQDQITSRDQFSGLLTKWNKLAQNLAVTTESLINSASEWSKIGFNLDMSEQLAEITSIFEKTAEISNEKATSTLISAAQAFTEIDDLGADDYVKRVEAVGNKINAIGNKYAIDSEGIADGLQNASAALKVAGNDLNETIALITATNKIYQNPEEGSNMLKVASMRLRGQVDALEEMGLDAEGVSTDLTKIQQQIYELTGNKVNIFEDDETMKSTYQMVLEIGEVFDSLSDRSQADLLEIMFGKQRASAGASLLLNYKELEKIKNDSINAANSMAEEYNKYMESAEASLTVFKEKLIETYSTFMSGDLIKYTADVGSGLLDLVNSTDLLRHGILAVVSLNIGKGITFVGASIASTVKQMNTLGNALQQVKNLPVDKVSRKESLQELGKETKNLTEKNLKLLLSQNQLEDSDRIRILKAQDLSKADAKLKLEKMGLTTATNAQSVANTTEAATTGTLKNAMLSLKASAIGTGNALKAAFLSNPIGVALTAITTAISVGTTLISKHNEKLEETRQKNIEAATTASESADKLKDLYNEYTRLASIQDRTTSEEEAFKTAVENITVALGDKAEILKDLTASTDEYADALARVTKEELQSQAVTATIGRKSAEEAFQSDIWSKRNGSQVSIDSNSKGKALSDEAQKAVDIVSDSLKEYETVNRTWKNISWDISSDDPVDALGFYNSLIEAREKLVLASEDDEALLDTEIYEDLNSAINTMSESLDTYIEKLYEEEKLNYMAQNGIPSVTEEYKAMESALVSVAGSSVDLQDKFKELLMSDFSDLATNIGTVSDAVEDASTKGSLFNQLTISSTIDQLNTQLKPAFDSLASAWQDIFTDDGFELNSIDILSICDSIKSALDEMADPEGLNLDVDYSAFEDFVRVLNNTESTEQEVKDSFDALATSITDAALSGVEDFETMKAALEDLGVVNSDMVAFNTLIKNTEALKEAGLDLENATYAEMAAFAEGAVSAENYAQAFNLLKIQKILCAENPLSTSADIQNLYMLAQAAGSATDAIQQLMALNTAYETAQAEGNSLAAIAVKGQMEVVKANIMNQFAHLGDEVDFSNIGGGKSSAGKAGSDAGDAYVEAFQEEYNHLKDLLDRGEISEAQYLSKLRSLYTKYFADRKEYLDEFKTYESEYLSGMLDLHNKALSGISTLLNRKISAANDAKDAAISALEEEKKSAEEAYQSQIDAIEEEKNAINDLIKEKNKKIDAINEEINAIEKAAETRKKNLDLQQQEFNLQKMLNQRTTSVYKEGEGFVFETDTSGIQDAREKVKEAQEALEIDRLKNEADLIQKEVDLLEEKKDALSEQQDALQKMIDESNKYYDNLIKQQQTYWDSMIKGMEQQKSRWEELAEVQEIAEAFSYIQQVFGDLGYTVEDVLNGSDAAFEDFKSRYISLISDVNNNSDFTDGLVYATGVAKENLGSFLDKTKETADGLDELGEKGSEMDSITEGMDKLSDSATTASTSTGEIASSMGELNTSTEGLSDNLNGINDALTGIPEADKFDNLTTSFTNLGDAIKGVADALGVGEEGTVGGLVSALQEISTLSLDGVSGEEGSGSSGGGIISQFQSLKTAVEDVTNAISGGGSSGGKGGDASASSSASMSAGTGGEGAGSLVGAIEDFKSATDEALGGGGEEGEGSEGGGTGAIPQFEQLKTAVNDVTTAIGSGDSEGNESSGEGESDNLIGSITNLGEQTEEILGESGGDGVIGKFEQLEKPISEADEHVHSISDGLDAIDGKEVECTIKVTIETSGSTSFTGSAQVLGSMNLNSAEYKAQYGNAHYEGTAKLTGDWGVREGGRSLVGEAGQELVVRGSHFFTVGDNGTEFVTLRRGDIVFNAMQTKELLKNGHISGRGKAFANGTLSKYPVIQSPETSMLDPMDNPTLRSIKIFEEITSQGSTLRNIETHTQEITRNIGNVNNTASTQQVINQNISLNCPNVTNNSGVEYIQKELGHLSQRAMQEAYKH